MSQIKPLGSGAPIWEHDSSDYPDILKMPMEDGHVITYRREIKQPHPKCLKAMESIRNLNGYTYGIYDGKHRKKTGDAGTSTGHTQK